MLGTSSPFGQAGRRGDGRLGPRDATTFWCLNRSAAETPTGRLHVTDSNVVPPLGVSWDTAACTACPGPKPPVSACRHEKESTRDDVR